MGQPVNKPYDFDRIKLYDERLNDAIKTSEEWNNKPTDYSKCHCCGTEWPSLIFKKCLQSWYCMIVLCLAIVSAHIQNNQYYIM